MSRIRLVAVLVVTALVAAAVTVIPVAVPPAQAATPPTLSLTRDIAPQSLYGTEVPVTLTAKHTGGDDGYNLSFRDVLPKNARFVGGDAPSRQIPQADGTTVLIWSNQSDLLVGTTSAITYRFGYSTTGTTAIADGTTLTSTANAYVSAAPRSVPAFTAAGAISPTPPTTSATATSSTRLVPYTVKKSLLDAPENEMLRGVHDHKYVYEITVTNNTATPTTGPTLTDWLPAGLEFLACTNVDNSAAGAVEYDGAVRISATGFPDSVTAASCAPNGAPVATTVTEDPDGAGELPSAVYTKVAWTLADLPANRSVTIRYAVGVPLRQNQASAAPATANLDNNTGDPTRDEQPIVNYAAVRATNATIPYTVGAYERATAEDVAVQKTVSPETITQGQTSTWTLNVQSSEYAVSTGPIIVTDVVPSGLDIASGGTPTPTRTENADGTITLTWRLGGYTAKNGASTIVYTTTTRTTYRNTTKPVSAEDSWTNRVALDSVATVRTGATTTGPADADDASAASQTAGPITIDKRVLPATVARDAACSAADPAAFVDTQGAATDPAFHPGDTVCWLVTVDFPGNLNTIGTRIQDVLPDGFAYTSARFTAGNTVTASAPAQDSGTVTWTVGDDSTLGQNGKRFQAIVASTAGVSSASAAGTVQGNLMKVLYRNTAGAAFQLRDRSDVVITRPLVTPTKSATPTTARAGTTVAFTVNVVNTGKQATTATVVDTLPGGLDCTTVERPLPEGATCTGTSLTWNAVAVPAATASGPGSTLLNYRATLPAGVGAGDRLTNSAAVTTYRSTVNTGGPDVVYTPSPTPAATATVTVPSPAVTKSGPTTATIGERITWDVVITVPARTTLYGSPSLTDPVPSGLVDVNWEAYSGEVPGQVSVNGNTVTVDLGQQYSNTSDAPRSSTLRLSATVADYASTSAGSVFDNQATLRWKGTSDAAVRTASSTVSTTIVEPLLGLTKSDSVQGKASPGQPITYTLLVGNTGSSAAHDTTVVDTLPAEVTPKTADQSPLTNGSVIAGSGGGVWNSTARTVTFAVGSVPTGTTNRLTIQATINDPLTSDGSIVNSARATTTSLSGAVAGERTSASSANTRYLATASNTLTNPTIGLTKSVAPTTATVGDDVAYTLTLTVPPGTVADDVTVVDTLPTGIEFRGRAPAQAGDCTDTSGANCTLTAATLPDGAGHVAYFLGDVDSSAGTRTLVIRYTGRLTAAAKPGPLTNSAQLRFDAPRSPAFTPSSYADIAGHAYTTTQQPVTATVTDLEPTLVIAKAVTDAGAGGHLNTVPPRSKTASTLTYRVTVTNTGTGSAFGTSVRDTLPAGIRCADIVDPGGATCVDGAGGAPATLAWTVATAIGPKGSTSPASSVSLSYQLRVPANAAALYGLGTGPELVNTADVPRYFGSPNGVGDGTGRYRTYTDDPKSSAAVQLDLATLSGSVSIDWNGSNSLDGGDTGLSGIPLTVTYLGADNLPGGGDDEVFSTTTTLGGAYSVRDLPGGAYTVAVDRKTLGAEGLTPTWDADPGTPAGIWAGTVAENGSKLGVDFGARGDGVVGDRVWFDQDLDGVQDPNEPGVPGLEVILAWSNGVGESHVSTTTTGADGAYRFDRLPAGDYRVTVVLPAGYRSTADPDTGAGGGDGVSAFSLPSGAERTDQDFGVAGALSIGDTVFLDRNRNGTQDTGDRGVPGAVVRVTPSGAASGQSFTATTDANGRYSVPNLLPGGYTVTVEQGTLPVDAQPTTPATLQVTLGDRPFDGADFGVSAGAALGGTVWWDYTGSHDPATGPGFSGVQVDVVYLGNDGKPGGGDDIVYTVTTGPNGRWDLPDVSAGEYSVIVRPGASLAGFSPTYDTDGGVLGTTRVTVPTAGGAPRQDVGYAGTGSIGDTVFLDRNGDGAQNPAPGQEPGLAGVQVTLTRTAGSQTLTLTTTTDAVGGYSFPGIPAGQNTVSVAVPSGFSAVSDLDGGDHTTAAVPLGSGQARTDADFGLAGTASLSGVVLNDRDGDGAADAGEPGLPGVTVTATGVTSTGTVTLTTTTRADGSWLFDGLPAGTWTVRPGAVPAGYAEVSESDGSVDGAIATTLGVGEKATGQLFGYRGSGSIGDTVFFDRPGRPGVPSQRVDLLWFGADGVEGTGDDQRWTTTTNPAGRYGFGFLPEGGFRVTVVGGVTVAAPNTVDPDGGAANTSVVQLTAAVPSNDAQDFGYASTAAPTSNRLGDTVWWDLDGDGTLDQGEPGIPGVRIVATWFGADGVPGGGDDADFDTLTDGDGRYLLDGLPDGAFRVRVADGVYPGLVPSADTADAAGGTADGASLVSLPDGTSRERLDVDFGFVGTGAIGDAVWLDEDGDGVRDPGEPGIPQATVTVTWAGPDGGFGGADDVVWTRITDAAGAWIADRLPAGPFIVTVSGVPSGLQNTGDPDRQPGGVGDSRAALVLDSGDRNLDVDFGYRGSSSVGDTVFLDVDGDGAQTGNEPGLPGIPVTVRSAGADGVLDTADDVVATVTTDADGRYSAAGLPAGPTRVSYDPAALPAGDLPSKDLDGGASASATQVVLVAGAGRDDVDFAVRGTASLGGTVFDDVDGSRSQGSGEKGVAGVGVTVTWAGPKGPVTVTTTTGPGGSWSIGQLPAGQYTVSLTPGTVPGGFRPTTATTTTVTLVAGGEQRVSFGIARPGGLPSTGTDALPWIAFALLLLAGGAALLTARIRPRSRRVSES